MTSETQHKIPASAKSALAGRRILVTGATSGIGAVMASTLAKQHDARIIAVGRRKERLISLQREIEEAGGEVEVHALSLTDRAAVTQLCKSLARAGIDDLVLNAGVTAVEEFTAGSFDADSALVDTNVVANLQLIRELIGPLSNNNVGGRILLVASLGGLVPLPYQAVYAGSKAFLVNFGLSLREELKAHGICVLVFAPGGIATEMTDTDAMASLQNTLQSADSVADAAIEMFIARRALDVPGAQNKLIALLARLLPRPLLAMVNEKIYRKTIS